MVTKSTNYLIQMQIDKDKLLLIGVALYWAEGAKEKEYRSGQGIIFSNSDCLMVKLFIKWLRDILNVPAEQIRYDVYIHDNYKLRYQEVVAYWKAELGEFTNNFGKIYYKKHNITSKRRNNGLSYFGLVRVKVTKSTDLNRRIPGLVEGICMQCGVV